MINDKPCRVVHCYKIVDDETFIVGFDGIVELNGSGSIIWQMADGKNTIKDIVKKLCMVYEMDEKQNTYEDVVNTVKKLSELGLLISNWDPLLKDNVCGRGID